MQTRERRAVSILALVDEFRARHDELVHPARSRAVQRILARMDISVGYAPILPRGFVQGLDGDYHITIRSGLPTQLVTKVILHELGHAMLHMAERGEIVRQLHTCARGEIREREADLFAALLWFGPDASPSHPAIAKLVADLEAPRFKRPAPEQIPLPLPQQMPVYRPSGRPKRKPRRGPWNTPWGPDAVGSRQASHDDLLFDWSRGGKPLAWFHSDLGWIDVYDRAVFDHRAVLLKCGDARAQHRFFVFSSSERRRYTFVSEEPRSTANHHLKDQVAAAKRMSVAKTRNALPISSGPEETRSQLTTVQRG